MSIFCHMDKENLEVPQVLFGGIIDLNVILRIKLSFQSVLLNNGKFSAERASRRAMPLYKLMACIYELKSPQGLSNH